MQILKILTARSCLDYCFLTRTGMFHIKVHSTFNLQAIYYAFLFQVYNIVFLFMRNLLSLCPHITHTPTGSEKSGVRLVGGHILLCTKKKCKLEHPVPLSPIRIHHSSKQRARCNHAHKGVSVRMSWTASCKN